MISNGRQPVVMIKQPVVNWWLSDGSMMAKTDGDV